MIPSHPDNITMTPEQLRYMMEVPLRLEDHSQIIDRFHELSYYEARRERSWHASHWMGIPVFKWAGDLWNYAELIWEVKPKTIIETGTAAGGSAFFFASMLDLLGAGRVITIDVNPIQPAYPVHKRIFYKPNTSSLDWHAPRDLLEPVLVILDSDHSEAHVFKELERYAAGVTRGSYLVVEDSNVGGHPVNPDHGPGPHEALARWLPDHPEFVVDETRASKWLFSYHTWLRRV